MKFFRNRTVLGVICILLSLLICFGLVPIFNRSASEKTVVLRVCSAVQKGEQNERTDTFAAECVRLFSL